jgi:methionyl-tRNA formyltransferase
MLWRAEIRIAPDDTAGTLTEKIAHTGADALIDVLPKWKAQSIEPIEQDESKATYAPMIKKEHALIRWERDDADAIARQVRAYNPWPMAWSYLDGEPLRMVEVVALQHRFGAPPGTVFAFTGVGEAPLFGAGFGVTTRDRDIGVIRVQPPGRPAMPASAYFNGHRHIVGKRLAAER